MKKAFTLIELLVVIAIIAILAAILFPVFAQAKLAAKKAAGMAQMKQLGIALHIYLIDSNDRLPPSTNYDAPQDQPTRIWPATLQPYVKNKDVFISPGANNSKYAEDWSTRHWQSVGYSDITAFSTLVGRPAERICNPGEVRFGCSAFWSVANHTAMDRVSSVALFADTPNGAPGTKYRGYVFGADNGTIYVPGFTTFTSLDQAVPLASDRDLVPIMGGPPLNLQPNQLKPIWCRYGANNDERGHTPIVFADSHAKSYPCMAIKVPNDDIVWRFR